MGIRDKLAHAWDAFKDQPVEQQTQSYMSMGPSYSTRPDRSRMSISNERSIISSIFNRVGIDVAAINMFHVRLDENGQFVETMDSGLNNCLTVEANLDQGARAFRQDVAMSLFDKGTIALVPIETTLNPNRTGGYDIITMRVGEIVQWYPKHVRVKCYNELKGVKEEITLPKSFVTIIENPLYSVMNEPNSTLQRLTRKLNLLDAVDEVSGSGKLDLIIQLPYIVKTEARKQQAEQRAKDIEVQLKDSKYGIAYTDGTEKITQLNRPAENNLLKQVEYLTNMLYGQLGITASVFDGTADEKTMINYYNRTIEPILAAIAEGMKRTFLTKTARTQRQSIEYFRDPFSLVTVTELAELADKLTRNEVASSNDIRAAIGWKPSSSPRANDLVNKNIPQPAIVGQVVEDPSTQDAIVNDAFDSLSAEVDQIITDSGAA